jgi:hypothetical protein
MQKGQTMAKKFPQFPVRTVVCTLTKINAKGERTEEKIVIDVPPGWKFVVGFAQHPTLIGSSGETRKIFNWEHGFRIEYEFYY